MPVFTSLTLPVPQGANSLTVTGVFPLPYQVTITPSWLTNADAINKLATSFLVQFNVACPTATETIDVVIFVGTPSQDTSPVLAGELITNIRDEIPDPSYDSNDNPLPDANTNLLRASTLYGWLDDGVRIMARAVGAQITDWTAIAQVQNQPWYQVNSRFQTLDAGFSNQWPLDMTTVNEPDIIWPSAGQTVSQSLWGFVRRRTSTLQVGLWPLPALTDPVTALTNPLGTGSVASVDLLDSTNFLSFGYIQIDSEILEYQKVVGNSLTIISRGQCGTTAAVHAAGAAVQHLGLWLKGTRSPLRIVNSLSPVELPLDIVSEVKTYVMSRVRGMENEYEEAARLRKRFDDKCNELRADPTRKENMGRIAAYGMPKIGPIYFPSGGGVVVP